MGRRMRWLGIVSVWALAAALACRFFPRPFMVRLSKSVSWDKIQARKENGTDPSLLIAFLPGKAVLPGGGGTARINAS